MTRRSRMCVVEECGRRAQPSQMVCKDHEGTPIGTTISREVVKLEREVRSLMVAETEAERWKAAKRFQQRVQRGEFAMLFTERFRELMIAGAEAPLDLELGALRMAVMRLMLEEPDPAKMATALSKVANSAANVKKTQQQLNQEVEATQAEVNALHEQFEQWKKWRQDAMAEREATIDQREATVQEAVQALQEAEATVRQMEERAAGAERQADLAEFRKSEAEATVKRLKEEEKGLREVAGRGNVARGWG